MRTWPLLGRPGPVSPEEYPYVKDQNWRKSYGEGMVGIADIHCHLLPYVDDGAQHKQESLKLLKMQYKQGVRTICFTPHLRTRMFETPDEEIAEQFEHMKERAGTLNRRMEFYLSREYFCDGEFIRRLESGNVLHMGLGRFVLTEFSHSYSEQQIFEYIEIIRGCGYKPLLAHIERFPVLRKSPEQIRDLISMGAKIQVNAGSILGREGLKQAAWCRRLLKEKLVHVVASDAHDPEMRPPELDKCAAYLERKYGDTYAKRLLRSNPLKILSAKPPERRQMKRANNPDHSRRI